MIVSRRKFDVYVSLGYNCEVSFRIRDFLNSPIDSYPFSWCYVTRPERLGECLENMDDILKHKTKLLPWGMILDEKYGLSFHIKVLKSRLLQDGQDNKEIYQEALLELQSRFRHLIFKFRELLKSNRYTLIYDNKLCWREEIINCIPYNNVVKSTQ